VSLAVPCTLSSKAVAAPSNPNQLQPSEWGLVPAKTKEEPSDSLALGLAPGRGVNGDSAEQAKAGERFRNFIDPIINPERYSELRGRFQSKDEVLAYIGNEHGKSPRTVQRYLEHWEEDGITGLTRKGRNDKGVSRALNEAGREFIYSSVLPKHAAYGEYSSKDVFRLYEEERRWRSSHAGRPLSPADRAKYARYIDSDGCFLPSAQLPAASYRTFCRQVAQMPSIVKKMARGGDEAYKNAELITYRDIAAVEPMGWVVMDHRVLDIWCLVPDRGGWKLVRPWITCAIDMRSRKWLAWCFVETPSSDSIATVLKQVFVKFGIPKNLYWDNGKDFRCIWLEGRREQSRSIGVIDGLPRQWTGVMETLGTRVHHAIVKRSRSKLIEPNFLNIAKFDRTLPEWCGHKPTARPERFAKMLEEHEDWLKKKRPTTPFRTIEQVAELYGRLLEDLNEREHSGEGMRKVTPTGMGWMCPNECFELLIGRVERRTIPDDVLQLCFAKRRELTVRNGEVCATFGARQYHYRLTGNPTALLALNDRKVELAYDPLNLGDGAIYYENRFVGLVSCLALRRQGESVFVEDEKARRRSRREVKRFINTVHQLVPTPDAETHLARRQAVTPTRPEIDRVEVQVCLPAPIEEARAAREAEAAFAFAQESLAMPVVERQVEDSDDGDEFNFFSDQGD
jgi:transposase InsO family protein